jgi:hypothetical protein
MNVKFFSQEAAAVGLEGLLVSLVLDMVGAVVMVALLVLVPEVVVELQSDAVLQDCGCCRRDLPPGECLLGLSCSTSRRGLL